MIGSSHTVLLAWHVGVEDIGVKIPHSTNLAPNNNISNMQITKWIIHINFALLSLIKNCFIGFEKCVLAPFIAIISLV